MEAIASRLEAIALRLETMAIRFLMLVGWRPSLRQHASDTSPHRALTVPPQHDDSLSLSRPPVDTTQNFATAEHKKLLGAKGISTRSKDATSGSWPYY